MSPDASWWEKVRRARDGEPVNEEKPIHIRVAEAVGWTEVKPMEMSPFGVQWYGKPPIGHRGLFVGDIDKAGRVVTLTQNYGTVDHYDRDWGATGPLIDKYGIGLEVVSGREIGLPDADAWMASLNSHRPRVDDYDGEAGYAATALLAVCNLILEMSAGGRKL